MKEQKNNNTFLCVKGNKSRNVKRFAVLFQICLMLLAGCVFYEMKSKAAEVPKETTDELNGENTGEKTLEQIYEEKGFFTEEDLENAEFSFEKEMYHVVKGDSITATIVNNVPEIASRVEYHYGNGMAELMSYENEKGTVNIYGSYSGTTDLSMSLYIVYCNEEGMYAGEKKITATTTVEVLAVSDIKLNVGETYELLYKTYPEYADWEYTFENNSGYVTIENGCLKAVSQGYCTLYLENKSTGKKIYLGYISIYSNGICFETDVVNRAIGSTPYQLVLKNAEGKSITWKSSAENIAKVGSTGVVEPVSPGTATIYAEVMFSEKSKETFSCTFNVTNPGFDIEEKSNLAKGYNLVVNITGTTSKGVWKSSAPNVVSVYSDTFSGISNDAATISANKKGSAVITVEIDGVTRSFTINVTIPKIKKDFVLLTKGMKQYIKVTGTNADSKIKYISEDAKVATVNSKGLIKAKKIGYCPIYVEVDRAVYVVDVNIGKKKAVKAVLNALKVEGAVYSQARRMQKGYYDCSSLVWRSYKPAGATFGQKYYAPVAATEALYCVNKKKTIPKKNIYKLNKLRVGDIMFYKRDVNNGRYKNIYHVVIYMGQSTQLFGDYKYTYGRIIHANGSSVAQGSLYNHDNCVVIGRPFK